MNETPPKKFPLLPKLIISAFVLGAILWGIWMCKFVLQTRATQRHTDSFFVPINTNPAPVR
jgi:hypothetical protein